MDYLDKQMQVWFSELTRQVKISSEAAEQLATTIAKETTQLSQNQKWLLAEKSVIPIRDRLDELKGFQKWMNYVQNVEGHPEVIRAQVITQNYICFVYLKDAWVEGLSKEMSTDTVTKKCCKFLTDNPVRAFRNAIAHANWRYKSDFPGIEYWAYRSWKDKTLVKYEVSQYELDFWQALARCTAYASYLSIDAVSQK